MCRIIAAYNKPLSERRIVRYAKDQIKDYNCFYGDVVYPYVTDAEWHTDKSVYISRIFCCDSMLSHMPVPSTCYVSYAKDYDIECTHKHKMKRLVFIVSFIFENNRSFNVSCGALLFANDNRPTNEEVGKLLIEELGRENIYTNFYLLDGIPNFVSSCIAELTNQDCLPFFGHSEIKKEKLFGWDTEFNTSDIENSIDDFPLQHCNMKVKDLIYLLEQCDPNADITSSDCRMYQREHYYPISLNYTKVNHETLEQKEVSPSAANVVFVH